MLLLLLLFLVFVLLGALLPLVFLLLPKHREIKGKFNPPPGPKGLPFIGNLHQFDNSTPHLCLSNLAKTYGPILFLRLGHRPMVVVQTAKLAKEVLKTQDHNFCNRPPLTAQHKLSYNGLDIAFGPYSDQYREIKKICVVHLLSSKRVRSYAPIRQYEISRMINKISSLSSASDIVNLNDMAVAFSSSNICRIAFGKRYDDEGVERCRLHKLMLEIETMFGGSFFSDYFPLMGCWVDKLTGWSSKLERAFKHLDALLEEIINKHFHQDNVREQHNFIDVLFQLRNEGSLAFELTLEHIKAVLMNIVWGGTNTSAIMVIWAMTELIGNPNVMKKVQEELRTMNEPGKSFIEQEDLPKFEYLKAVVKETFRLHPAAPLLISHEAIDKCSIQGYDILSKTLVYVNAWAIGRDSELWKDPEKFVPERFLESHIDYKGQDFELLPFGAGRRMCPGMFLGATNFELVLANLLYCFDWELPVGTKLEDIDTHTHPGISMHNKNPLCLVASKLDLTKINGS